MGRWEDIRRLARQTRAAVDGDLSDALAADAVLAVAARQSGISCSPVLSGDPLLDGAEAVLDREADTIWYNQDLELELRRIALAHEYGHVWLHDEDAGLARCSAPDFDPEESEEDVPIGVKRVEGYGPAERREREANVFARELLLPTDLLRQWFLIDGLDPEVIATRVGVPEGMVYHQLARALLTPAPSAADDEAKTIPIYRAPDGSARELELDETQLEAAHAERGPLLVEAGPGTGKTRTLVGRITFLLGRGVPATSVLALTFSNRAAEEMRERVAVVVPDAARSLWIGTFHAFGLELLRKYGTRLGLPPRFTILDPVNALLLLERILPDLHLDHYQDLAEPAWRLRDILAAIARAKEELVGPEQYSQLAEQMRADATTLDAVEAAEKALEVAHVYHVYQDLLVQQHLLDFGDLIGRTANLLRMHPDVREQVQQTYPHILVDEYQDVNRASAYLLRELAGLGTGLWVVGDVRQAIYRFRGAAPDNLHRFAADFPGAVSRTLARNYRSQPDIIGVFAGVAAKMRASATLPFIPWVAARAAEGGTAVLTEGEDLRTEVAAIARAIADHRAAGISYRQQAILCRSHAILGRIAPLLEMEGIPALYLGDLFERDEVRDLLSLLALVRDTDGDALVRVARFPGYSIPLSDVLAIRMLARERNAPPSRIFSLAEKFDTLSTQGKVGLARLAADLNVCSASRSAWQFLAKYLFACPTYLQSLLDDRTTAGQQRRLAVFQLLECAHEHSRATPAVTVAPEQDPLHAFLDYVRQLAMFGEDKYVRQPPEAAAAIDAVRLLTVHASKGLEFPVIYLPALGQGYFPARRQAQPCPPPVGMLPVGPADEHDEEEECLFFVALSRAQDFLHLSRARRYGDQHSKASRLLELIPTSALQLRDVAQHAALDTIPTPSLNGNRRDASSAAAHAAPSIRSASERTFDAGRLDMYRRCPRQYAYAELLGHRSHGIRGGGHRARHQAFEVIRWLQDMHTQGHPIDEAGALRKLAEIWNAQGQDDSPHTAFYRRHSERLVVSAVARLARHPNVLARPKWEVTLPHGRVRCAPDSVEILGDTVESNIMVHQWRTRRLSRSESDKDIYALYDAAAKNTYPLGTCITLRAESLATGHIQEIRLNSRTRATRLSHYDAAMGGILRNEFPAQPSDRECPQCPFYFICPVPYDA